MLPRLVSSLSHTHTRARTHLPSSVFLASVRIAVLDLCTTGIDVCIGGGFRVSCLAVVLENTPDAPVPSAAVVAGGRGFIQSWAAASQKRRVNAPHKNRIVINAMLLPTRSCLLMHLLNCCSPSFSLVCCLFIRVPLHAF